MLFALNWAVAFQSKDIFFDALTQMSNNIDEAAIFQANKVYDNGSCRGICSLQDESLGPMYNFMQAITSKTKK